MEKYDKRGKIKTMFYYNWYRPHKFFTVILFNIIIYLNIYWEFVLEYSNWFIN